MMRRIGVKSKNTIIIEDSIIGLRSALASGAHVIARKGSAPNEKLQIAHKTVDHLDNVTLELIETLLLEPF